MGRTALRRATVVLTAALVLTVTVSSGARAADAGLTAAMLDTGDLPAGFTPDASLTGPLTGQRAQELGLSPGQTGPQDSWVRTWLAADGSEVIETAVDTGTGGHARAGAAAEVSVLQKQGATRQPATGFDVYGGYVGPHFELVLPLARGPYLFGLCVLVPAASAGSAGRLMSELGAAQARKVPADTPDTALVIDPAGVTGAVVGVLVGYLLLADGVGYLRDPLRRRPWRPRFRRVRPEPADYRIVDVSAAARRSRRIAAGRLAVQLAGLGLVAYAADVFEVRFWYAYLAAGLAVVWAGGGFIRPGGAGRGGNRAVLAGSHRILVTVMLIVASAMILFSLAAIVSFGWYQTQPPGATVQSWPGPGLSGTGPITVPNLATGLEGAGLGLLVVGAVLFWLARRLGAADARRLMLRDPRPPVLYLRSFGDDRLRLRTATLGRPSLVERFTLRRFDRFEEVLVRHLSRYGPVIAVSPPSTRLAPLAAARETIYSADWQAVVTSWMAQSARIVFLAPPGRVTEGLQWELRAVAEHGQWDKAIMVVPPVPAEQLQTRWRAFGAAHGRLWPFTVAGPLVDPLALVLAFRHGQWDVTTADRRTEWSYAAALDRVLGDPDPLVPPAARDPRPGAYDPRPGAYDPRPGAYDPRPGAYDPRPGAGEARPGARWGPLTLPVAALILVMAAVMAGAGTWFALDRASAGRLPALVTSSVPASPSAPVRPARPASAPPAERR